MIALLRVDNRLLHGQILEAWVPRLKIGRIVVADDEAAASRLARAAMTLCLPPELAADVVPVGQVDYAALAALQRAGFEVEARALPVDAPAGARQIAEKYDAAGERR